jgi:TIR domain
MGLDSARESAPRYRAFVSYSHADARFVGWLHRKLEATRLPGKARLAPIFIDRAELVAGPDLSAQVREALARSAALVVVASPTARTSRWVGQEIALFRELHPDRPILAALVEGEPDQAFPPALLSHHGRAVEPLAADFRKGQDGRRLGLLKIVAGLTAQPLDQLVA